MSVRVVSVIVNVLEVSVVPVLEIHLSFLHPKDRLYLDEPRA